MAMTAKRGAIAFLVLFVAAFLVGCSSPRGSYPDPNGPRNGAGFLVDPRTGLELPGQPDVGGPGN